MGYVAVRGGGAAIEESLRLLEYERVSAQPSVGVDAIEAAFPELVDQVMGEASLYAPRLAALALKQAQGSPDEAVFLLRAFRSTLERPYVSHVVDTGRMRVRRRISAAFKDVPGGQILGATRDYSHRLLSFDLMSEDAEDVAWARASLARHFGENAAASAGSGAHVESGAEADAAACADAAVCADADAGTVSPSAAPSEMPRVLDYLRAQGLVASRCRSDDTPDAEPADATVEPLSFPAPRSVRLQTLARGMTQAVEALGYAAIRGFGPAHPTVGELRAGEVEVAIDHPLACGRADGAPREEDGYYLGLIPVTEVESVFTQERAEADACEGLSFEVGYGLVMGRAETKAIAMSVLDRCLESGDKRYPTQDEEFVLYHVDSVEANGFISHLKLPHYVTFQSKLSSVRATRQDAGEGKEVSDDAAL